MTKLSPTLLRELREKAMLDMDRITGAKVLALISALETAVEALEWYRMAYDEKELDASREDKIAAKALAAIFDEEG